jgi:hypothetical protein
MTDPAHETAIAHPEEMRAGFDLQIGNLNLKGNARLTPAGIVTGGIMTVAILLATTVLVRAARWCRPLQAIIKHHRQMLLIYPAIQGDVRRISARLSIGRMGRAGTRQPSFFETPLLSLP